MQTPTPNDPSAGEDRPRHQAIADELLLMLEEGEPDTQAPPSAAAKTDATASIATTGLEERPATRKPQPILMPRPARTAGAASGFPAWQPQRLADGTTKCTKDVEEGDYLIDVGGTARRVLRNTPSASISHELYVVHFSQCRLGDSLDDEQFAQLPNLLSREQGRDRFGTIGFQAGGDQMVLIKQRTSDVEAFVPTRVSELRDGDEIYMRPVTCNAWERRNPDWRHRAIFTVRRNCPNVPTEDIFRYIGLYAGDGHKAGVVTSCTTIGDSETIKFLADLARNIGQGHHVVSYRNENSTPNSMEVCHVRISTPDRQPNHLRSLLQGLDIYEHKKFSPELTASIISSPLSCRLAFLAGLIDTDGHKMNRAFVLAQTTKHHLCHTTIMDLFVALAQSIGVMCSLYLSRSSTDKNRQQLWNLDCYIRDGARLSDIPVLLERKKVARTSDPDPVCRKITVTKTNSTVELYDLKMEGDSAWVLPAGTCVT